MIKRLFLSYFILSFLFISAQEKKSYKIEIKIKGLEDSVLYLASYYGDKTLLLDTAEKKGKYNYLFEGKNILNGGIYIIAGQEKNSIFEFLISDSQDIKFESDLNKLVERMKVKGSNENALFFDYLAFTNLQSTRLIEYKINLEKYSGISDSISSLRGKIQSIENQNIEYRESIIEAYPEAFISELFKTMRLPTSDLQQSIKTKQDSNKFLRNYKKKYWDNFNFDDDRLLRTPIFQNKLDDYFKNIAHPELDSLKKDIDDFFNKMNPKSELYKHSLWYLTLMFDNSQRMGYEAILVHFADNYYRKEKADWMHPQLSKNIIEEANKRRNALIGKQAPNLIMLDLDSNPVSLYAIDKSFTIVYFWDPDCQVCKVETSKLNDFYNQYAKSLNLEVFAVCTLPDLGIMKNYIAKNKLNWINVNGHHSYTNNFHELYNIYSIPGIFILNKEKTIIAKQLKTEQILPFIKFYQENVK